MIDVNKILSDSGLVLNPTVSVEEVFEGNEVCPISGEVCLCQAGQDLAGSEEPICCPSMLFCTQAYLDNMAPPEEPEPERPPRRDNILDGGISQEEMNKLKAMNLQGLLDEVAALVEDEDYVRALERLQEAMEEETCELCLKTLMAEANRIATVANVCELPSANACEKEKEAFGSRFRERMQELTEVTNEIGSFTADTKPKSAFRVCMSDAEFTPSQLLDIKDAFQESKRHAVEHGIKSRMCGQTQNTFEDALQFMKDSHPDWLTLEGATKNG